MTAGQCLVSEGVYSASSNANQSADFTPESTAYTYQDFAANSSLATWQELVNFTDASVGARSILSVSTIFPNGANLTFLWDYFNASGTYSDGTSDTTAMYDFYDLVLVFYDVTAV